MNLEHIPFKERYRNELLQVWEASVRATHKFLEPDEVGFYKGLVEKIEFGALNTHVVFNEEGTMVGFWGTEGVNLVMLFLHPEYIGKGIGKAVFRHIEGVHNITKLEVNEQNPLAVAFYQKMGFEITARKPVDDLGKPHPILIMQKQKREI